MDNIIPVIQAVLGFLFTLGGIAKLFIPYARYTTMPFVGWSKEFTPTQLRLLGVVETIGGLGVLVPLFVPSLTAFVPLAAIGVALYMAGAMATHFRRSEYFHMVGNLMVFLVPALAVAYGRLVGFV